MIRRLISGKSIIRFLTAIYVVMALSLPVGATEAGDELIERDDYEQCGDDAFYSISDNVITFSGSGALWEESAYQAGFPWNTYKDTLTSAIFESGITSIPAYAFYGFEALSGTDMADSIERIGSSAFSETSLTGSVSLPDDLVSIGTGVFPDTVSGFSISSSNSDFVSANGVLYDKERRKLLIYPGGRTNSYYSIPDGVTSIADYAFDSDRLKELYIPASLTELAPKALYDIPAIEYFTVSGDNTVFASDSGNLYSKDFSELIKGAVGRTGSIKLHQNTMFIDSYAFYGSRASSIEFSIGLSSIGEYAFVNCTSLKTLYSVPVSLKLINAYTFNTASEVESGSYKTAVNDIYYNGSQKEWSRITIGTCNDSLYNAVLHYNSGGMVSEVVVAVNERLDMRSLLGTMYKRFSISPEKNVVVDGTMFKPLKPGTFRICAYVRRGDHWEVEHEINVEAVQPKFTVKKVKLTKYGQLFNAAAYLDTRLKPTSWRTSDVGVASVNTLSGLVVAQKNGTAKISAVFGEGSDAAVYSIRVKVVIPKISRKRISMLVGARFNLKMKHTKLTPVWSSTNTRVATVDSRGRVTALAAGTAVIKATIENVDYTCTVTVKNGNKL